eukprot:2401083-Amphidinium_carterae.1
MYVTRRLIQEFGQTEGCPACAQKGRVHSKECRERLENLLSTADRQPRPTAVGEEMDEEEEGDVSGGGRKEQRKRKIEGEGSPKDAVDNLAEHQAEGHGLYAELMQLMPAAEVDQYKQGETWDMFALRDDIRIMREQKEKERTMPSERMEVETLKRAGSELENPVTKKPGLMAPPMFAGSSSMSSGDPMRSEGVSSVLLWSKMQDESHDDDFRVCSVEKVERLHAVGALTSNREYTDSITGKSLDREEVNAARVKELEQMAEFGVTAPATWEEARRSGGRVVHSKWVDTMKGNSVRARLVATEINTYERTDVFAATPPLSMLRWLLSRAATGKGPKQRRLAIYDVSVAFFHGEAREDIFVVPPREIRRECPLWKLRKALYGTRDAGQIFQDYVARKLTEG